VMPSRAASASRDATIHAGKSTLTRWRIAVGSTNSVKIEVFDDVGGILVELSIQFSGLHTAPPAMVVPVGPR
jgi:hypothetical protein